MGYRRFTDASGDIWDVKGSAGSEWEFLPVGGNKHPPVRVRAPGYEKDPFELSNEELQHLLGAEQPSRERLRKSPFKD
jgi:hypothetical protein